MSRIDELAPEYEQSIKLLDELLFRLRDQYMKDRNAQLKRRINSLLSMRNDCIGVYQKIKNYYIPPEQAALENKYRRLNYEQYN